jgi:hypothetical protein
MSIRKRAVPTNFHTPDNILRPRDPPIVWWIARIAHMYEPAVACTSTFIVRRGRGRALREIETTGRAKDGGLGDYIGVGCCVDGVDGGENV